MLAMEGLSRPHNAVLELLSKGDLLARGCYRWRKYESGDFFQFEGTHAAIKPKQWQTLADLLAEEQRQYAGVGFPESEVDLAHLGLNKCEIYVWEHGQNRFSTAFIPPGTDLFEPGYYEEWFSAWEIDVSPRFLDDNYQVDETTLIADQSNKGGRPPVADWEAAALEMAGRYYRGDFKPKTIADVVRELAKWLGDQDKHPSDSVLRDHAKPIFEAFRAWESE